ncbi:MAG: hypothetical protein EGR08_01010 [Prevotella sp.]|nr:hypothetical protein [Prevotella sp.]
MLLSVIAPQAADAFSITLNVDDASRINVFLNGTKDVVNGDNVFEVKDGDYLSVTTQNNAGLVSVFNGDKAVKLDSYSSFRLKLTESEYAGAKFIVKTATLDEMRTASCKVTVDDPSKVTLRLSRTFTTVQLKSGENEVKFIPGTESTFTISPQSYNTPLYKVTRNSVAAEAEWGSYTLKNVAEGDVIDIQANYPDIDCAVKFNVNAEGVGFIKSVTVNGNEVTNYLDDNFTVKCGSTISITRNSEDYKLESFKVNGEDKTSDFYEDSYNIFVTDATTLDITAKKYTTFKATVDIDDVSHATVYKGYSYYDDAFDMKNGKNEIEVSEKQPLISLVAKDGYYFTSVNDGTTEYTDQSTSEIKVDVTDGMVLKVVTAAIVRDKKALVYVDDRSATSSMVFSRGDYNRIEIGTGYNELEFYKGDNPFSVTVYANTKKVYKNDVAVDPTYSGGSYFRFSLEDGDVVKMFFTKTPATVKADITAKGGAENLSVVKDRIQPVADFSVGISCLEDTELAFAAKEGYSIKALTVDGTAATAEADGTYKVVVKADANIVVDLQTASGISSVTNADASRTANVYNANGVLVLKNATPEQTAKLAKGLYIINGKKVVR